MCPANSITSPSVVAVSSVAEISTLPPFFSMDSCDTRRASAPASVFCTVPGRMPLVVRSAMVGVKVVVRSSANMRCMPWDVWRMSDTPPGWSEKSASSSTMFMGRFSGPMGIRRVTQPMSPSRDALAASLCIITASPNVVAPSSTLVRIAVRRARTLSGALEGSSSDTPM